MATLTSKHSDRLGEGFTALCGGALALNLLLVVALLGVLCVNGMGYFWQRNLVLLELDDGARILGELHDREEIPAPASGGEEEKRSTAVRLMVDSFSSYPVVLPALFYSSLPIVQGMVP